MIFLSGIHGVGKDYFSKELEKIIGIKSYSASELIEKTRKVKFESDKKTREIEKNQEALINAIEKNNHEEYILNGHFCLLNPEGKIEKIPIKTFYILKPEKIIILKEKLEVPIKETKEFQKEEINYGKEVAKSLEIPILIINPREEIEKAIDFIGIAKNRGINL